MRGQHCMIYNEKKEVASYNLMPEMGGGGGGGGGGWANSMPLPKPNESGRGQDYHLLN